MFKTSAIHPPPNKLGGGLLAEDDKSMHLHNQLMSSYNLNKDQVVLLDNQSGKGLCQKYNQGVASLVSRNNQGWIIFQHDDISLDCSYGKLADQLRKAEEADISIVAVAGNTDVPPLSPGYWWYGITKPTFRGAGAFPQQIAAFDGVWFAVRSKLFADGTFKFDESFDGYHYYDADFAATARAQGALMAAVGISVTHHQNGKGITDPEFIKYQEQFVVKWGRRAEEYKRYDRISTSPVDFVQKTAAFKY